MAPTPSSLHRPPAGVTCSGLRTVWLAGVVAAGVAAPAWGGPDGFQSAAQIAAALQPAGGPPRPATEAERDAALLRGVLGGGGVETDKALRDVALPEPDGRCPGAAAATGLSPQAAAQRALAVVAIGPPQQPQVSLQLRFSVGGYALSAEDKRQLDELVSVLTGPLAQAKVTLAGHTDRQGSAQLNLRLSCARGLAVLDYLVVHGVSAKRLGVYGFGSAQAAGQDEAASRRVDIRRAE